MSFIKYRKKAFKSSDIHPTGKHKFLFFSPFRSLERNHKTMQTRNPHITGDTCWVSEGNYYSAITCAGKHHCSLQWRLPSSVEGKMNSTKFIYHISCLSYAPQKWKKGGNKWQSKSITRKRIMSPVKYTLCSSSPFSFPFFFFLQRLTFSKLNFENLIHY